MARKKAPLERILGSVKEMDVVLRPSGEKRIGQPVSLKLRTRANGRVNEEWYSVSKALKPRVRQLAAVPEEIVGHTFEFLLNASGEIVEMLRVSA